jgi:hypothetical protein
MGSDASTTLFIPVSCAPKKAPCPKCGKHGRRKRKVPRRVRTVVYKAIAYLEITCGEYAARRGKVRTAWRGSGVGGGLGGGLGSHSGRFAARAPLAAGCGLDRQKERLDDLDQ